MFNCCGNKSRPHNSQDTWKDTSSTDAHLTASPASPEHIVIEEHISSPTPRSAVEDPSTVLENLLEALKSSGVDPTSIEEVRSLTRTVIDRTSQEGHRLSLPPHLPPSHHHVEPLPLRAPREEQTPEPATPEIMPVQEHAHAPITPREEEEEEEEEHDSRSHRLPLELEIPDHMIDPDVRDPDVRDPDVRDPEEEMPDHAPPTMEPPVESPSRPPFHPPPGNTSQGHITPSEMPPSVDLERAVVSPTLERVMPEEQASPIISSPPPLFRKRSRPKSPGRSKSPNLGLSGLVRRPMHSSMVRSSSDVPRQVRHTTEREVRGSAVGSQSVAEQLLSQSRSDYLSALDALEPETQEPVFSSPAFSDSRVPRSSHNTSGRRDGWERERRSRRVNTPLTANYGGSLRRGYSTRNSLL